MIDKFKNLTNHTKVHLLSFCTNKDDANRNAQHINTTKILMHNQFACPITEKSSFPKAGLHLYELSQLYLKIT